jgi:hypothetical protein
LNFVKKESSSSSACDLSFNVYAKWALNRTRDVECRKEIEIEACKFNRPVDYIGRDLGEFLPYKLILERKCPKAIVTHKGCSTENDLFQELEFPSKPKPISNVSLDRCLKICLSNYYSKYAAHSNKTNGCFCFKNISLHFKFEKCTTDHAFFIYDTGLIGNYIEQGCIFIKFSLKVLFSK